MFILALSSCPLPVANLNTFSRSQPDKRKNFPICYWLAMSSVPCVFGLDKQRSRFIKHWPHIPGLFSRVAALKCHLCFVAARTLICPEQAAPPLPSSSDRSATWYSELLCAGPWIGELWWIKYCIPVLKHERHAVVSFEYYVCVFGWIFWMEYFYACAEWLLLNSKSYFITVMYFITLWLNASSLNLILRQKYSCISLHIYMHTQQ